MSSNRSQLADSFIAAHVKSIRKDLITNDESTILLHTHHFAESAMNNFIMSSRAEIAVKNEVLERESIHVYNEVLHHGRQVAISNLEKLLSLRNEECYKLQVLLNSEKKENISLKIALEESRRKNDKLDNAFTPSTVKCGSKNLNSRKRMEYISSFPSTEEERLEIEREISKGYERLLARSRVDLTIARQNVQKSERLVTEWRDEFETKVKNLEKRLFDIETALKGPHSILK